MTGHRSILDLGGAFADHDLRGDELLAQPERACVSADAHVAPPEVCPANASAAFQWLPLPIPMVVPFAYLLIEVLRRPLEFAQHTSIRYGSSVGMLSIVRHPTIRRLKTSETNAVKPIPDQVGT